MLIQANQKDETDISYAIGAEIMSQICLYAGRLQRREHAGQSLSQPHLKRLYNRYVLICRIGGKSESVRTHVSEMEL